MKKKITAFSLMEMMIVLLIIAIVIAASAPMVNKKMLTSMAEKSPWIWTNTTGAIAYNINGNENQTAVIGDVSRPNNVRSRLHIMSNEIIPQITLNNSDNRAENNIARILYDNNNNLMFSTANLPMVINLPNDSVAIGINAIARTPRQEPGAAVPPTRERAVSIGVNTTAQATDSIALGQSAQTDSYGQIVIGAHSNESTEESNDTKAYSISIGTHATTLFSNDVAIGYGAITGQDGEANANTGRIAIGLGASAISRNGSTIAIGNGADGGGADSVALGTGASCHGSSGYANYAIAIGHGAKGHNDGAIAIGSIFGDSANKGATKAEGEKSIAIGVDTTASANNSVAIGANTSASANANNSVAIGAGASASANNSVAIGAGASATAANTIVLGTSSDTVYIPGNIVVGGKFQVGNGSAGTLLVKPYINSNNTAAYYMRVGNLIYPVIAEKIPPPSSYSHKFYTIGSGISGTAFSDYTFINVTSDRRLKNVGKAFEGGLADINKLEVFNFTFKKDTENTPHVGVMAQDLQKVFPNAVTKGKDGFLRIRFEDMFFAMVNAIQELSAKIDNIIDKEIASIKTRLTDIEEQNRQLVEQFTAFDAKIKAVVDKNAEIDAKIQKVADKNTELENQLKEQNAQLEKQNKALTEKNAELEKVAKECAEQRAEIEKRLEALEKKLAE